jgi:hypothetical protein
MHKRCKFWIPLLLVATAGLGLVFELESHLLRGWLNGEAFYDGRPTSYWRAAVENWVNRFPEPGDAEDFMRAHSMDGILSSIFYHSPRPTLWGRFKSWMGVPARIPDDAPPAVLVGGDEAEPVLRELENVAGLKRFVEHGRRTRFFWGFEETP